MPKNTGMGGNKRKKGKKQVQEDRELRYKEESEEYAQITKILGDGRFQCKCADGVDRIAHVRGKMRKRTWLANGDIILVSIREFEPEKCDVVEKYKEKEVAKLKSVGEIPDTMVLVNSGEKEEKNDDEGGIVLEDSVQDTTTKKKENSSGFDIESENEEEEEKEEKKIPFEEKKPSKYKTNIIDLNENEENQPTKKKIQETLYGIQILGLPYETTEFELRQMFSKYGEILKIYLPKYKNTNKNIGHCYIYFSTEESATKSLEMNNQRIGRRYMEISLYNMRNNFSKESGKLDPDDIPLDCTTAFVKNLPYNVTEEMVRDKFKPCGEINQLRFVYEPNKIKFKGFCYIDFKEHKGLVRALKLNGDFFEGRKLYVDYEQGKPKSNYKNSDSYKNGTSEVRYLNQKRY